MILKDAVEPEEHDVQEVRCHVTGLPIPSVPAWYATVSVKFVSDAARQKSGGSSPLPRIPEIVEPDTEDGLEASTETEISLEDVDEDIPVEDIEIDLGEGDAEAEGQFED